MNQSTIKKQTASLLWLLLLPSCSLFHTKDIAGMLDGSSPEVDVRFEQSMEWNERHGYARIAVPDNYRFYVASDSHIDSATTYLEQFVSDYRSDSLCALAFHLGDIVNTPHTFKAFQDVVRPSSSPVRAIRDTMFVEVGNHDLFFGQWTDFRSLFHTSVYWVETVSDTDPTHKLDLFICLDSGEGSLGQKQMKWLAQLLEEKSKDDYRHIVVCTHTNLFCKDIGQGLSSNFAEEESAAMMALLTRYGVSLCLTGHGHYRNITHHGGVEYIVVDALQEKAAEAAYLVGSAGTQLTCRFVELSE